MPVTRMPMALLAALSSLVLPAVPAAAEFTIPGYELVHNAPSGTTLATPDLRDAATVWCDMIAHARHAVDFEQFYVAGKPGEALDRVIAAMEAAGRRGVRIRFLMEKKGLAASDPATIERLRRIPNLDFRLLACSPGRPLAAAASFTPSFSWSTGARPISAARTSIGAR